MKFAIIGIGGVLKPEDYENYMTVGADAVQSATGALMNPYLAYEIYEKEVLQKSDYKTARSLGNSFFFSASSNLNFEHFKKMYSEMLFPKMLPEDKHTLLIRDKPFKLKNGENGRKVSSIYLNHRNSIFVNSWDRKLLVQMLDSIIQEKVLKPIKLNKKNYGVIAIPSSSSPELTALMLDLLPHVDRSVVLSKHHMYKEQGAHRELYGEMNIDEPWILIDDVFTSGKTMESVLNLFPKDLRKSSTHRLFSVTLTCRNPDMAKRFKKKLGIDLFYLSSLDEILKFHWKNFSRNQKKIIIKERKTLS